MSKENMSIKAMFKTKQTILESKLSVLIDHPSAKGDHCESAWIDFFRSFLPSKFAVDKGFVFDSKGKSSDQIDIIIYDAHYAPLIFGTDAGEKFITAESVYAIFESKPKIDKKNIEYANNKVKSVVDLDRTSRKLIIGGKVKEARELTPIIGGILAIDSIGNDAIEQHLVNCHYIDIGCAIKKTAFVRYREKGKFLTETQFASCDESVLAFFFFVLDLLYPLGTVAAIDIRDYADATMESVALDRKRDDHSER